MADERWKECKHHHDGCACREHAWAEQVARLTFELDVEKSNCECLKGAWDAAVALAQEHCPKPVLGQAWLTDGIPLLAERAKRAEAEVARLKAEKHAQEEHHRDELYERGVELKSERECWRLLCVEQTNEVARLKGETYCAYCGERFPLDAPDSCEKIGNHIKVCPEHPMRVVEQQLEEMRVAKVWMEQKAAKFRDQCDAERRRASELGAEVERLREAIKTAHADGASALVASFENTDQRARVCELEAEVDRLKQATARAYPDSVAQIVEGIKVYPQPTNGELEAEVARLKKEHGNED